jgi:nitric oxide reductase subunit B
MQTDVMQTLRWLRVIGDTVFTFGIGALGVFVVGLSTGASVQRDKAWSTATGGSAPPPPIAALKAE